MMLYVQNENALRVLYRVSKEENERCQFKARDNHIFILGKTEQELNLMKEVITMHFLVYRCEFVQLIVQPNCQQNTSSSRINTQLLLSRK